MTRSLTKIGFASTATVLLAFATTPLSFAQTDSAETTHSTITNTSKESEPDKDPAATSVAPSTPAEPTDLAEPVEKSEPTTGLNAFATNLLLEALEGLTDTDFAEPVTDSSGASITVQQVVEAGGTALLRGSGFTTADGSSGATIVVKLRFEHTDGESGYYTRVGDDILDHPTGGSPDATMWAVIKADDDGSFEEAVQLPSSLQAGQRLVINAASGILSTDQQHSLTTKPLTVGGIEWIEDDSDSVECVPETSAPQITVAAEPSADGTLHITGIGWCNSNSGGAILAFKIDEGKVSRLDDEIHENRTIWYLYEADDETGNVDFHMTLPDGTTTGANGSTPAFGEGEHTIRVLTGSLQEGDPALSLPRRGTDESTTFTVGNYKPNGQPDIIDTDELGTANAEGMTVSTSNTEAVVTLPNAEEGDWVYISAYTADGSPRWPWGSDWYQLGADKKVVLPLTGLPLPLPTGKITLVAQSGNRGEVGEVIGWRDATLGKAATSTTPSTTSASPTTSSVAPVPGLANSINNLSRALEDLDKSLVGTTDSEADNGTDSDKQNNDEENDSGVVEIVEYVDAPRVITNGNSGINSRNSTANSNAAGTSAGASGAAVIVNSGSNGTSNRAGVTSGTAESNEPQPTTAPDAPVQTGLSLNVENKGGVEESVDGTLLTMTIPTDVAEPGEWVYIHSFDPSPAALGWTQINEDGEVSVDAAELGDGIYKFSLTDTDGELLGWASITLTGLGTPGGEAASNSSESSTPVLIAQSQAVMKASDWLLIIGAIAVVQFAAILTFMGIRRQNLR